MRIVVGSDHGGLNLKEAVKQRLESQGHEVSDVGVFSTDSSDYPDQAGEAARALAAGDYERGVLVCGSGVGMSITANRFKGVRAVLAPTVAHAALGRQHNNANMLCMGERLTPISEGMEILDAFMKSQFEGGRHQRRIDKIDSVCGA